MGIDGSSNCIYRKRCLKGGKAQLYKKCPTVALIDSSTRINYDQKGHMVSWKGSIKNPSKEFTPQEVENSNFFVLILKSHISQLQPVIEIAPQENADMLKQDVIGIEGIC
ncbi:hypothetical protein CEXT_457691 [Caerostris extrusa]|uniref:Uncharacterized protein n=1 Tax=Caerostris extrusa TaxID=172846 RepID=A0AAV4V7X1_CAEEX|nr:hypothetical protein CEXT_457691 [Caerostris extrusa]